MTAGNRLKTSEAQTMTRARGRLASDGYWIKPYGTRPVPYTPLRTEGKLKLQRFLAEQRIEPNLSNLFKPVTDITKARDNLTSIQVKGFAE